MIFWKELKIRDAFHSVEIQLDDNGNVEIPNLKATNLSITTLTNAVTLPSGSKFATSTTLPSGTTFEGPATIPNNSSLGNRLTLPTTNDLTMIGRLRLNKLTMQADNSEAAEVDFKDATVSLDGGKTKLNNLSLSEWINNAIGECRCAIPNGIAVVCAYDNDVYVHPLLPTTLQLRAVINGTDSAPWVWKYNTDKGWVVNNDNPLRDGNSNPEWSHIDNVTNIKFELLNSAGESVAGANTLTINRGDWEPTSGKNASACYFIPIQLFFNNTPALIPAEYGMNNYFCPGPVAASVNAATFVPLNCSSTALYNRASLIAWGLEKGFTEWKGLYFTTSMSDHTATIITKSISSPDHSYSVHGFKDLSRFLCDEGNISWYDTYTFYKIK